MIPISISESRNNQNSFEIKKRERKKAYCRKNINIKKY